MNPWYLVLKWGLGLEVELGFAVGVRRLDDLTPVLKP